MAKSLAEQVSDKTSHVSSEDDSSDTYSEHKLKTEDRRKMVPSVGILEELAMKLDQEFSKMNEKIERLSREGQEREAKLWAMVIGIDIQKEKLKSDLKNNEAAYDNLKQQFDDLQYKYDALCNEMKTMEFKEKCLVEDNQRLNEKAHLLQNEIKELGQELVRMQPTNRAKGKKYGELMNQQNVRGKQGKSKSSPKKDTRKSGK